MLIAFLTIFVIILLLIGFGVLKDWYSYDRHKAKVKVSAKFDTAVCGKEYPLKITVLNGSSRTINETSVYISVTNRGFSTKLNDSSSQKIDKILPPMEGWESCWKVATKDAMYSWEKVKWVSPENKDVEVTSFYLTFK